MEINTEHVNVCSLPINQSSKLGDIFNFNTYQHFSLLYLIGSLFSFTSLLAVIASILVLKPIRKHPAHLVLCRVLSDLIVSLTHIAFFCFNNNPYVLFDTRLGNINLLCLPYSLLINFGMFSGYAWNFIIAVDLILAVKRPFRLHGKYLKYYHCAVWTVSMLLSAMFVIIRKKDFGMSMFFHCWVNVLNFEGYIVISSFIYYIPTLVMFLIGSGFGFRVVYRLKSVALFSPEIKSNIAKHNLGMLWGLGVEWSLTLFLWLASIVISYLNLPQNTFTPRFGFECKYVVVEVFQLILAHMYVVIHSTRGCIVLAVWIYSISVVIRAEKKKKKDLKRKITLRKKFGSGNNGRGSDSLEPRDRERGCSNDSDEKLPLVDSSKSSDSDQLVEYMFNRELRRYAVVCINYSLLDSAKTAQSGITGDSQAKIQHNVTLDRVIQKSESRTYQERHELRTLQIPTNFMYHKFEFTNFSPLLFKNLRDLRGIDEGEFMKSFPLQDNETTAMVERFTEGKSGSFFFFSYDKKYIVKTINKVELNFMIRNLQKYYKYLRKNTDSLLTRYYSMLKIRFSKEQEFIYVVVMENVFYLHEGLVMEERYDLKGSRRNRQTVQRGMERPKYKTMKDMDLDCSFKIDVSVKDRLLKQLDRDTDFLRDIGSMDYSLLMGVTTISNEEGKTFSTSMQNNINSETEKEITIGDASYDWVNYNPQELHWYRNGAHREHTPSKGSGQLFDTDAINPAESIFTQFRRGFFKLPGEKIPKSRSRNEEYHEKEACYLYIGLIDMLQPYDLDKKVENFLKTKIRRLKEADISAVEPIYYKARFMRFMQDNVFY